MGRHGVDFHQIGTLRLATNTVEAAHIRDEVNFIQSCGIEHGAAHNVCIGELSYDEICSSVPWVSADAIHSESASIVKDDGWVDASALAGAYWSVSRELGAVPVNENATKLILRFDSVWAWSALPYLIRGQADRRRCNSQGN